MANTIQIILDVDDKGSAKVKQFSASLTDQVKQAGAAATQSAGAVGKVEAAFQKMQDVAAGFFTKAREHWMAFTAATVAAGFAINKALDYISLGGAAIKAEESFRAMAAAANVNVDKMLASMKKAVDGFVDDSHLMQKAAFAMAQDIDPNKIPALFEAARIAARKTGMDVMSAIDGMVQGIATNMPRSLRQMGAITKEQMSLLNKAMADGVTEVNLLDLVLANAAVDAAKLGTAANDAAREIDRMKVASEELKETLGVAMIYIAGPIMRMFQGIAGFALDGYMNIAKLLQGLNSLTAFGARKVGMTGLAESAEAAAKSWKDQATTAADKANELYDKFLGIQKASAGVQKKLTLAEAEAARTAVENTMKQGIEKQQLLTRTAALKIAEEDKKALGLRLAEAQRFYQSIQQMIQKNAEEEKRHIEEVNALYRQQADIRMSTEAQIRGLREIGMTPGQKYESQKSALFDQYMAAMRLAGQEQIKALEEYKSALASFGQTWSAGVSETTKDMLFGEQTSIIIAGQDIIRSVISDIEAATVLQQGALAAITAETEKQIYADQVWGETLRQTAEQGAGDIRMLQGVIGDLEAQIAAMQKTITISGDDRVSHVVDNIARALDTLHDKTVYITTVYRSAYGSESGGSGSELNLSGLDLNAPPSPTPYALGTGYVPKTGMYLLHRGEAVETPRQAARQSSMRFGDIVINVPESAAPQRPEDWRSITRDYIVPELRKIGHA